MLEALTQSGLFVEKEKQLPIVFNTKKVGVYCPDFLVEDKIVLEIKAKPAIINQDTKQFWQYLTGTNYKLGFLINFGALGGAQIIRRVYDEARTDKNSA